MRRQFILTIWIVLLCHQIHCAPATEAAPADGQPQDDEYYDDQFEPIEDLGDLDGAESKEKKQGNGNPTQPGEVGGADPPAKSGADTPEAKKSGAVPAEPKEKPEQAGKKPESPTPPEKKPEETTEKKPEEKGQNGSSGKPAEETPVKEPQGSSETAAGKEKDQKSSQTKGFKKADQRQAEKSARRSKWQLPKEKLTGPKTEQAKTTSKPNNKPQKSKPTTKGDRFAKVAMSLVDKKPVTVAGSISDLLSAVGQRVNSFEDINKKLLPPVPRGKGVSGRSVGPKLGAKSLPLAGKSLPLARKSLPLAPKSIPSVTRSVPSLGTKSLPGEEPPRSSGFDDVEEDASNYRISPFARRKQAERLAKLYGHKQPGAGTPSKPAKTINAKPLTSNAGTEEYEKLLARRGQQLDELEEDKPMIATKSLPPRLKSVSGSFEDIASQLSDNISSVSAVNKDKLRSKKMKARGVPDLQTDVDSKEEVGPKIAGRAGGEPCPCYSKYSPLNVVRRTTKRVVRAVKKGTNMLYDVADAGLDKTKDLKDATRNDIVDPIVNMLPVVSPAVTGIVDAGDAVADGTISGAKAVVQGGKNLNEGFYNGIEGMLKKDKSCRCAEDADINY